MWPHALTAALGIWLMLAPAVLGYGGAAQTNDHIAGPLIASCAVIAWWQVTRGLRWINVLLGLWLLAAPWVLGYGASLAGMNSMITGALLAGLSFIKGKSEKPFGGGWRELLRPPGV